jgi:hypothetical protein
MSSKPTFSRRDLLKGALAGGGAMLLSKAGLSKPLNVGPSTSGPAYVLPSVPGVEITAILTARETADNGYQMVGIPDGLGALENGQTFSLFMNHEINTTVALSGPGGVRAHGRNGAFVSKWTIDRKTLRVLKGEDLTPSAHAVFLWNPSAKRYDQETTTWNALCSADLPDEKALRYGSLGTSQRIFCDGEEINFGRAWARIVTGPNAGQAWELPRLGKMAFENVVACPHGKAKTIVALFDDGNVDPAAPAASNPSEVFIYIGEKQESGNEIEMAGFTNGKLYGIRIYRDKTLVTQESNEFGLGDAETSFRGQGVFELVELGRGGDVSGLSGLELEEEAITKGILRMQRPEDGAWDPRGNGNDALYFVTTASVSPLKNSRLWRLQFEDLDHPEKGGKMECLLTNTPGRMLDNVTIDRLGRILIQEDTGNSPHVSKIWLYNIDTAGLTEIAHHDPELFEPGVNPGKFITQDEESSGIIDAQHVLGEGWFLFVVQNHKHDEEFPDIVQGGQLLAMFVDPRLGRE